MACIPVEFRNDDKCGTELLYEHIPPGALFCFTDTKSVRRCLCVRTFSGHVNLCGGLFENGTPYCEQRVVALEAQMVVTIPAGLPL